MDETPTLEVLARRAVDGDRDLEPAAFRKRLQRAREAIEAFTRSHCGLVSDAAACACNRRVPAAVQLGRVQPTAPLFAGADASFGEARDFIRGIEEAKRVLELHRGTRPRGPTLDFTRRVVSALEASLG